MKINKISIQSHFNSNYMTPYTQFHLYYQSMIKVTNLNYYIKSDINKEIRLINTFFTGA